MMGTEIITHELDLSGLWVIHLQQLADLLSPVYPHPLLPTADPPPAAYGIKEQKEGLHAMALVVIILGRHLARLQPPRLVDMGQQLHRGFIHGNQRLLRAVFRRIEVE